MSAGRPVKVTLGRGVVVYHDGHPYGEGSTVTLPADQAARLVQEGSAKPAPKARTR